MVPMYTYHFILTYLVFGSIKMCIAYWFFYRVTESGWFIWVAQCNHIVMDVHDDENNESWLNLQVTKYIRKECEKKIKILGLNQFLVPGVKSMTLKKNSFTTCNRTGNGFVWQNFF